MPVKLVLTRTEEPDSPDEYVFDQMPVVIGRAGSSQLTIPDYKRIVSKEHAKIDEEGGTYTITDLGSKNYTFLNGKRLESRRAYPIEDGDTITLGDFQIEFETIVPAEPDYDKTVFDLSYGNPFDEVVDQLSDALQALRKQYDDELPSRRTEALREALRSNLPEASTHEAEQMIGALLAPNRAPQEGSASPQASAADSSPSSSEPATSPTPPKREPAPPQTPPSQRSGAQQASSRSSSSEAVPEVVEQRPSGVHAKPQQSPSAAASISASATRLQRFALAVLEATAKLVGTPWQFRHEFIGQTIMQSADAAFLYEGDAADLQDQLLSDDIDDETFSKRLQLMREALDDLAVHQVALLDGYKAAVQGGAERLLDALDPSAVVEEMDLDSPLFKLMPAKGKAEVLEKIEDRAHDIRAEDWSVTERRVYRPAFVKAYLARMTSVRRS
ncbi:MAG: FHA domain-containing protein [Bacteroidetes bacterium]|jgi:predicted component of type VI protein secretion system|nr:FHA domain-containing protein [Bacteroidota bacterium]